MRKRASKDPFQMILSIKKCASISKVPFYMKSRFHKGPFLTESKEGMDIFFRKIVLKEWVLFRLHFLRKLTFLLKA